MTIEDGKINARKELMDHEVVITGGSSGLGAAFARLYASRGHSVLITGRRVKQLQEVCNAIREEGTGHCDYMINDLTLKSDLATLSNYVGKNQSIQVLINNAGLNVDGRLHETPLKDAENLIATHVNATVTLCHAAMPGLVANQGDLIQVSSIAALLPTPLSPLYGPSKAFIKSLSQSLKAAYGKEGVRVLTVCPGFFRSDFHTKLGLQPASVYRESGLLKARDASDVARDALTDLAKGRPVSVSGWNFKLLYHLVNLCPDRILEMLASQRTSARL